MKNIQDEGKVKSLKECSSKRITINLIHLIIVKELRWSVTTKKRQMLHIFRVT